MYYFKYNEIDLTDIVKVRSVEIPSLPTIEHSSFEVFERNGNVYNGASFNEREIKISFIIYPKYEKDYDMYVNDVKRAFYTKEECRLFCGNETLYMWCVPTGEILINELGNACAECEVELIAYDPYWYSTDMNVTNNEDAKNFEVVNKSDVEVYPIVQIGITKPSTFVQIENQATNERILIGGIPSVEGRVIEKNTNILNDSCESTSGWTQTSAPIEGDRSIGGTMTINDGGWGLMLGNTGSGSTTWKGSCYKKTLDTPIKDFQVTVNMNHDSSGINGDPSRPYTNDVSSTPSTTIVTGTTTTSYQVTAKSGLILRKGASTSTTKLLTMPLGTRLTGTMSNGWLNTTYNGKTGYCYSGYLKTIKTTNTVTQTIDGVTECNYVTSKSTAIRANADESATNLKTIPAGTCIRVITSAKYPTEHETESKKNIFYKLAKPYDGKTGYVLISDLVEASNYTIDYEDKSITADDKTGVVELYGFSSNNVQLFKLSMNDKSEYYEHTYPSITKNGGIFLEDSGSVFKPKTHSTYSSNSEKIENILSGKVDNGWSEFDGVLYIERVENRWYAYVQKKTNGNVVREIYSNFVTDITNSEEKLAYIVVYFGTTGDMGKASAMAISHITIKTATEIDNTVHYNFQEMSTGDILTIDCSIPSVRLNDVECNGLVDVGSQFFTLQPGTNNIKVASDDTPNIDILWQNRLL